MFYNVLLTIFFKQVSDWDFARDGLQYARLILLFSVPLKKQETNYYDDEHVEATVNMAFVHCFNFFAESHVPQNTLRDGGMHYYRVLYSIMSGL